MQCLLSVKSANNVNVLLIILWSINLDNLWHSKDLMVSNQTSSIENRVIIKYSNGQSRCKVESC